MPQTILFELDVVRVTAAIVKVGATSYQVANIGGVRVAQFRRCNRGSVLTFLLGAGLLAASAIRDGTLPQTEFSFTELGTATIILAFALQFIWPRRAFGLMLKMSSSEVRVLTSLKAKFVSDVKQAIEGAFIIRARLSSG
jgi:hypothetical protein